MLVVYTHSIQTLTLEAVISKATGARPKARRPNPNDPRLLFGRRVRQLRLELGLSQERLAELSSLHRNYVGEAERGKRNVGLLNVVKLAHALGVRPMISWT
ncbi:MAG TPA: helix-turn-helix transcriptional regulator [Bryobacteraceae bacterium]